MSVPWFKHARHYVSDYRRDGHNCNVNDDDMVIKTTSRMYLE